MLRVSGHDFDGNGWSDQDTAGTRCKHHAVPKHRARHAISKDSQDTSILLSPVSDTQAKSTTHR